MPCSVSHQAEICIIVRWSKKSLKENLPRESKRCKQIGIWCQKEFRLEVLSCKTFCNKLDIMKTNISTFLIFQTILAESFNSEQF